MKLIGLTAGAARTRLTARRGIHGNPTGRGTGGVTGGGAASGGVTGGGSASGGVTGGGAASRVVTGGRAASLWGRDRWRGIRGHPAGISAPARPTTKFIIQAHATPPKSSIKLMPTHPVHHLNSHRVATYRPVAHAEWKHGGAVLRVRWSYLHPSTIVWFGNLY